MKKQHNRLQKIADCVATKASGVGGLLLQLKSLSLRHHIDQACLREILLDWSKNQRLKMIALVNR